MKGKYAVRAESRTNKNLEYQIATLKAELEASKADVRQLRQENTRLRAIEAVFDSTKDVIAELDAVKKRCDDLEGRNFVLNIRVDRWAKMMMQKSNIEFLRLTPDLWSDLVELGYYTPRDDDPRWMKRSFASKARFKKSADIGANGGKVVIHG